jgi:ankyrin repeat protein
MRLRFLGPVCVLHASGLTALGADGNPSDDFYQAIRRDDFAAVEKLLQAHGPNLKDRRGSTPLMYAAASGSEAMMRRLIQAGADPKIRNAFSASALHWCGGIHSRMKLLVENGADVNL